VRLKQMKKLDVLLLKLNTMRNRPIHLEERDYYAKVVERVPINSKGDK